MMFLNLANLNQNLKLNSNRKERKMKFKYDVVRNKQSGWLHWFLLLACVVALSGCAGGSGGLTDVPSVGPTLSSNFGKSDSESATAGLPKIDVVVPVFDPNIPEDSDTWKKKGIYPELRRAEANRFALKMKSAIEDTKAFGTVRVVPSARATGDLYVSGKILESNGEDVKMEIAVADISGKKWFTKDFKHRVKEGFHKNYRNKGKDAYDPMFKKAAVYIVKKLKKYDAEELAKLQLLSEMRFGANLSEETFAKYLKGSANRVQLAAIPANDDPMLLRIKPIRVRDQLFIDRMQTHYTDFDAKLDESYLVWQKESLVEVRAARKAKRKAITKGILGGLLAIAGTAAAVAGADSYDSSAVAVGTAGAVAGALIVESAFQDRAEMKVHRETLAELGESIDIELAPQVVEYEDQTTKLVGNASEQHKQWIAFLKKIYALESTPEQTL